MRRSPARHVVALLLAIGASASASQRYDQPAPGGHSPRNANYEIEVTLDDTSHTLRGREHITWRNISARTATEVRFHLYWNAWRNQESSFMREGAVARNGAGAQRTDGWSAIDITGLRIGVGTGAVTEIGRAHV